MNNLSEAREPVNGGLQGNHWEKASRQGVCASWLHWGQCWDLVCPGIYRGLEWHSLVFTEVKVGVWVWTTVLGQDLG